VALAEQRNGDEDIEEEDDDGDGTLPAGLESLTCFSLILLYNSISRLSHRQGSSNSKTQ